MSRSHKAQKEERWSGLVEVNVGHILEGLSSGRIGHVYVAFGIVFASFATLNEKLKIKICMKVNLVFHYRI